MVHGSHLYGLNHENSDMDYKGIYVPSLKDLLLGKANESYSQSTGNEFSKNTSNDTDTEILSLKRFLDLAIKGDTMAIDMLHCKEPIFATSQWRYLVKNRKEFYTKNLSSFVEYVRSQASKYGVKGSRMKVMEDAISIIKKNSPLTLHQFISSMPITQHSKITTIETKKDMGTQTFYEICGRKFQDTSKHDYLLHNMERIYANYGARAELAKENKGVDWKAVSHALRAGYQAREIYKNGDFEYPLKENDFILQVKLGKLDWNTEVQPILDKLVDEVTILSIVSKLPEKCNKDRWDEWLYNCYIDLYDLPIL